MFSTLATGLAMAAVALMARSVQAESARHEAEVAELARTRAELRALRAQINPHFLFNALNTIRYFVRTDPDAARCLLLNLSEIFQRALHSGESVPLRDELGYVKAYLALEKARLGDRLVVEWSVQGEVLLDCLVPTLILQLVVENAVIHGIAGRSEGGIVRIAIERAKDDLLLRVEDDGPGIPPARLAEVQRPAEAGDESIGLRNVFAGIDGAAVYKSIDGGGSWVQASARMPPEAVILSIVVDPTDGQIVYAAGHLSGVYVSTNGGGIWQTIDDGLDHRSANTLSIS